MSRPPGTPTHHGTGCHVQAAHDHGEDAVEVVGRAPRGAEEEFRQPDLGHGRHAVGQQKQADQRHGGYGEGCGRPGRGPGQPSRRTCGRRLGTRAAAGTPAAARPAPAPGAPAPPEPAAVDALADGTFSKENSIVRPA
ncbi:MAG: hypothetical protein ACLTDR_10350 [Adlercreutzia equolifaciens]